MNRCVAFLLVCLVSSPASFGQQATPTPSAIQAAPATPLPNTLMDGTAIKLRISESISSADAKVGQQVPFEVTEDVVVQGLTIVPKGTPALATVTVAESKKRMGRGGKLDVNIDSTRLIDGSKIQLRATKDTKGGGHVGAMTGAIVATSIVFFPAAPFFLFMHGKDIDIPKGTEITAFVQGDTRLDMARLQTAASPAAGAAAANPANLAAASIITPTSSAMSSIQIDSSVPGADIEVDDAFVGNTPSTISLTPGPHTITVKKKGYTPWTRKMNISGPNIHLNAELTLQ